uniref:Mitochondrial carrier protein n=3 Tax=Macrostomum lignano TaxID=282301 RepID=A0A1I8IM37_9PLAT
NFQLCCQTDLTATMTSAYLKNLMGVPVTDEELENIPHPNVELTLHTTVRFIQAGAVLGSLVAAPLVTAIGGPRTLSDLADRALRYGVTGARVGAVAAPLVTYAAMRKEPEIAVYDRVYRLRYHSNQVRHDRYFLIGASIGGASNGPAGALVGILGGIALATAYNSLLANRERGEAPLTDQLKSKVQAAKRQQ